MAACCLLCRDPLPPAQPCTHSQMAWLQTVWAMQDGRRLLSTCAVRAALPALLLKQCARGHGGMLQAVMAGRAAEEVVFGCSTSYSMQDLEVGPACTHLCSLCLLMPLAGISCSLPHMTAACWLMPLIGICCSLHP